MALSENGGMSPADFAAVMNGNGGGFGNGWGNDWWILLLFLFGWGGRGFGGGNCGANSACATPADVNAAVYQQTLTSKLDQQTYGIADSTYALNNTINQNFRNVDNAICTLGYQTQAGFSGVSAQLAQCCCDTRAAISDHSNALQRQISDCCCDLEKANMQNRFDAQAYNCATLQAIDKLGDRVIGYMSDKETQRLREENYALRLSASQAAQNGYLISQLRPSPIPAYQVPNPYCCGNQGYGFCA